MSKQTVMVQGTMSNVGKSLMVTGLCRMVKNWGLQVAPFKPQNMALNSAVTLDQGEIGRSQALQAFACGIAPHSDMNPILLKPTGERGAQLIIQGQVHSNMSAQEFHAFKSQAMPYVLQSHERLCQQYDVIIAEGAGSPSEINLRKNDIANMGFAQAIRCPVILVADIDRGGVFAQILGTLQVLDDEETQLIKGIIINGFRGDINLLKPGLDWLKQKIHIPLLGVIPHMADLVLDAEDSLSTKESAQAANLNILVPKLPRMSNATDFEPLIHTKGVSLRFSSHYAACDVVILPGSKSVIADLDWLIQNGWQQALNRHLRYGGKLMGICGGYQMLGKEIRDPLSLETQQVHRIGLGFLDLETTIKAEKQLNNIRGTILSLNHDPCPVSGYEIHMGETMGPALNHPFLYIADRPHGVHQDNIIGCYLHGLFDEGKARDKLLAWMGFQSNDSVDLKKMRNNSVDLLARNLEKYLDTTLLKEIIRPVVKSIPGSLPNSVLETIMEP